MDRVMALRRAASMAVRIQGRALDAQSDKDGGHFYTCPMCSQLVDRRQLGEVLHHEIHGHKPIPAN